MDIHAKHWYNLILGLSHLFHQDYMIHILVQNEFSNKNTSQGNLTDKILQDPLVQDIFPSSFKVLLV